MPKIYKEGEIPPYKTKEYYKLKMREYRKNNPAKYSQKKPKIPKEIYWSVDINDKKYIFKSKKDIKIAKIEKESIDNSHDILCF